MSYFDKAFYDIFLCFRLQGDVKSDQRDKRGVSATKNAKSLLGKV